MTTASDSDSWGAPGGEPARVPFVPGDDGPRLPTLPAAGPTAPAPAAPDPVAPSLPTAAPPPAAAPAPEPVFDAKAMVESQKQVNSNPTYGAMPRGTDEGREAARQLREAANRKRRRKRVMGRLVLTVMVAGLAVGGYLVYRALDDETETAGASDEAGSDAGSGGDEGPAAGGGEGGALTPLGEQEMVIDGLDDLNATARPGGGLLDAVEDAREAVGQAQPPVADTTVLLVADVFTPAVLDRTDVLDDADGHERFVVRSAELAEVDPSANEALLALLAGLPQRPDDPALAVAPVVLPGDVGIAIQRDGDRITRIVAVAADPAISAVGP